MQFNLNGSRVRINTHPMKRLLDVIREDYRLTGRKKDAGKESAARAPC